MSPSIDKRKMNRVRTENFNVEVTPNSSGDSYTVEVINVSAKGLCFIRKSVIEKGEVLLLTISFAERKVSLRGKVIRISGREVAVNFLDQDEIDLFIDTFNELYALRDIMQEKGRSDQKLYRHEDAKNGKGDDIESALDIDEE